VVARDSRDRPVGRPRHAGSLDSVTLKFQVSPRPCLRIRRAAYLRRARRAAEQRAAVARADGETGCIVAAIVAAARTPRPSSTYRRKYPAAIVGARDRGGLPKCWPPVRPTSCVFSRRLTFTGRGRSLFTRSRASAGARDVRVRARVSVRGRSRRRI